MNRISLAAAGCCAIWSCAAMPALAITIDTVPVGNAGNAPGPPQREGTFGNVAYNYRIGTYEVTNAQYAAFLNEKATSDPLALYSTKMGSDPRGGISRNGSDGSYTYSARTNMGDKPVSFVSLFDAMRFANWLSNGQGNGDTETGAYTLDGAAPLPSNHQTVERNTDAIWFVPSPDEWHKAAYHQPASKGGDSDDYWDYPTASNIAPAAASANTVGDISNPGANVANYGNFADWNGVDGNVTTVGSAGPLSESYYGTSDQGGNVWEWVDSESFYGGELQGMRGGAFTNDLDTQLASTYVAKGGLGELVSLGFRVATIPEPSTAVLAIVGMVGLAIAGWGPNFRVLKLLFRKA